MKPGSKRRRPKAQIQEEKREAQAQKEEIERKLQRLEELEAGDAEFKQKKQKLAHDEALVKHLYDGGFIKEDNQGTVHVVDDPIERTQLAQ
jgi:hypothetical protein